MNSGIPINENENTGLLVTLAQRYPISYRNSSRIPVQLIADGNRLRIRFFVRYAKSMLQNIPGTSRSYADAAESGIRRNWGGLYYFPWLADDGFESARAKARHCFQNTIESSSESKILPLLPSVRTTVEFVRSGSITAGKRYPGQRYYPVRLSSGSIFPAHVISPPWRWYWGFFRTFQLEALYLNWSVRHPGRVTFQKNPDRHIFQQICAHETGHLLGIGDAYGANYRFFYEAPGTSEYMMCHNRKVQSAEMEMILHSHMTNKMHYFPKKFHFNTFISGLKRAYRQMKVLVQDPKPK